MMKQSAVILKMALMLLLLLHGTDAKMEIITTKLDIEVGEEIFMLCKAGGEGDITWKKDGSDIDVEDGVSKMDESSSKLVIKKASMQDAGKYTCLCDFDNGDKDNVLIQLYVYEGPSFGSTNTYHEFLNGIDGLVPCLVTGQPVVDVHWLRNREEISSDAGRRVHRLSDNSVLIENVKREDAGTYVCEAQIRGRPIKRQLSVSVVVNAPPSVHLGEVMKTVIAGPETNVSLVCSVDGQPQPNITWIMPATFDPSHHQFNSDRSELTIRSVTRADYGGYICTATNKIAESSATIMLHVYEAPEVFVSAEQQSVSVGERVSVSCNVSGHPQPELHWLNKHNGRTLDSTSGLVRVVDGALVINEVVPSDGGIYSCMAVSTSRNASRDVAIHTQPGPPHYLSVSPGLTSVLFSLKTPPISGGTPITSFVLQWRQSAAEQWKEITVPASDPLAIPSLTPYTLYTVRLAALNAVGVGQFSDKNTVRTQGLRGEPDSPVLLSNEMKVEGNSFSVPLKQTDDGGTPLLHFDVRYRQDKERSEWKEMQLPSNADSISLQDLSYSSEYQLEVLSVNPNGSSIPAMFNFSIANQPVKVSSMTKGQVVIIVMVIFLVVFLVVDATCCYRNRCGLLMSIAVKVFGQKVPGHQMIGEGEGTNGEVKLKGISTPRGSVQHSEAGVQTLTKDGGPLTEITCDKAPLTKHEKKQASRDMHTANA
ncbi:neural cell adhesion molecule 1 isoform X1 [Anarrhichthys ocellatus]|uniref:neural cell adhesion molecule 1 isoform X1 n=1 Tax=Anarrhichthys ocellatus TaxID=433405 RepID=UPI0012ED8529|nr:neural cell adhesion molecule 1-like isoform X1 [Anarrhichthys ocellatus]